MSFALTLPILTVRASYRPGCNSTVYCYSRIGNRNDRIFSDAVSLVLALPIFTASRPATIVGVQVLNFCVRDGNRWTHTPINTNYICRKTDLYIVQYRLSFVKKKNGDPYRIRTDVNGVRGRCLNHLTNGPLVHLQGLEPGTY